MGLPRLDPDFAVAMARRMEINVKKDGSRQLWPLTSGQEKAIRAMCLYLWCFLAKPRQEGMSTVVCFMDALWTWCADETVGNVGTNIILDTAAKATKQLGQVADFLKQMRPLGVEYERRSMSAKGPERIEFPNGSVIAAEGVNGSRVASSYSYHRYHLSEMPYWNRATDIWTSIKPALAEDGLCVIETTCDITDDGLTKNLWYGNNEFKKVFFSVEDFDRHRRDPNLITDEEWAWAQEEGFTDRSAASWWVWALDNEAAGDFAGLCHAYPQKPEHLFMSAAGRFIRCQPEVLKPVDVLTVEGDADSWKVEIYRKPEDTSGQCVIGVDTAAGKERDHSAVAVIDKADGQVCASFNSDLIWTDDLARVAQAAQEHYTRVIPPPHTFAREEVITPHVVIEDNGIGAATVQAMTRLGRPHTALTMTDAGRLEGLLMVKRACERGELYGPRRLADEADSLHHDDLGRFKGAKDLCMALGFALRHLKVWPYIPPRTKPDPEVFDAEKMLRRRRSRRSRTV